MNLSFDTRTNVGDDVVPQRLEVRSSDGVALDAVACDAAGEARGLVVLVHGITVDMDEGGMFVRLADHLAAAGLASVRFSFRGHGASGGRSQDMTVAGEVLDLE